jgi:hypothetical protein
MSCSHPLPITPAEKSELGFVCWFCYARTPKDREGGDAGRGLRHEDVARNRGHPQGNASGCGYAADSICGGGSRRKRIETAILVVRNQKSLIPAHFTRDPGLESIPSETSFDGRSRVRAVLGTACGFAFCRARNTTRSGSRHFTRPFLGFVLAASIQVASLAPAPAGAFSCVPSMIVS